MDNIIFLWLYFPQQCILSFFKRFYLFIFRKRGREISMCGCLSRGPYWGPVPQPRHVPWLGIKPVTRFWFTQPMLSPLSHTSQGNSVYFIYFLHAMFFSYLVSFFSFAVLYLHIYRADNMKETLHNTCLALVIQEVGAFANKVDQSSKTIGKLRTLFFFLTFYCFDLKLPGECFIKYGVSSHSS